MNILINVSSFIHLLNAKLLWYDHMNSFSSTWSKTGFVFCPSDYSSNCYDGKNCAELWGDASIQTQGSQLSTQNYKNIILIYTIETFDFEPNDECQVSYYDGTDWNLVQSYTDALNNNPLNNETQYLPVDAADNPNFQIKFYVTPEGADADECFVDELFLFGTPITTNPTTSSTNNPTTVSPTNNPMTASPTTSIPTTFTPTNLPTTLPTTLPTIFPTFNPTNVPTIFPIYTTTNIPTIFPTIVPTKSPTTFPTFASPTISPTKSKDHQVIEMSIATTGKMDGSLVNYNNDVANDSYYVIITGLSLIICCCLVCAALCLIKKCLKLRSLKTAQEDIEMKNPNVIRAMSISDTDMVTHKTDFNVNYNMNSNNEVAIKPADNYCMQNMISTPSDRIGNQLMSATVASSGDITDSESHSDENEDLYADDLRKTEGANKTPITPITPITPQ